MTDAIMSGLPPHIAQAICRHKSIDTTIGYKAVYPAETIEAHRAFIARRRATRPSEQYRTPTDEEWDTFLAHFEKRKVAIGTCARAFGSPCLHEHACVRCSLLRPDPAQRARLEEIRDNLIGRIAEAQREGWLGEVEGLQVSLAGASDKLAQLDRPARSHATVELGTPTVIPLGEPLRRDDERLRPGVTAICDRLGLRGLDLVRFPGGSMPVYAVGDQHVLKLYPSVSRPRVGCQKSVGAVTRGVPLAGG